MGVHLGSGRVARDVDAVRDAEAVVRVKHAVVGADADRLEPKAGERIGAADREQDLMTIDGRAVRQLDP
jgi:hypothetical protein